MSCFGKNIATLRDLRSLTQKKMAEKLGIKRSRLGSWEEGRAEPGHDTLIKVADYFGVSIDKLLKEEI